MTRPMPMTCESLHYFNFRRSPRSLMALLLSSALVLPGLTSSPVHADGKAALEIQSATRAYEKARQDYETLSADQSQKQSARDQERRKYLNDWAEIWERKRHNEKAQNDLRQEFAKESRALKDDIVDLKSARGFAEMEVKSRNDRLLNILHALKDAQSGQDQALIQTLEAEADKKRSEWREATQEHERIKRELGEAEARLAKREADVEAEIERLRAGTPTRTDIMALETAYSERLEDIGHLPLPEKLEDLATDHGNTADDLLAALLKNQPVYVKRVSVSLADKPWYEAQIVEDPNGAPDPQSAKLKKATDDALKVAREDLEDLDRLLKVASREMDQVQADWKDASERAGYAQVSMILRDRDMAAFTLIVESAAVVITSVATGGLAVPTTIGLLETVLKAAPKARKLQAGEVYNVLYKWAIQGMNERGLRKLLAETGKAHRGKKWSEVILGGPTGTENLLGLDTYKSILVGDYLEFTLANWNTDVKSFLPKGVEATTAGIALTTTAAKLMAQTLTDIMKDKDRHRAFQNTLKAALDQQTYMRLAAARRALKAERDTVTAQITALNKLKNHGLLPRKLEVKTSDPVSHDDAAKIGRWEVRVTFSGHLDHPPELASFKQGVTFDRAQRSDSNPAEWIFEVNGFDVPDDQQDIQLVVSINPGEPPYSHLDAEPQTPTFPASLTWHEVRNYEQGSDKNHRLQLKPDGITVALYDVAHPAYQQCRHRRNIDPGREYSSSWNMPFLDDRTVYFDAERNRSLKPFKTGDILVVCVATNGELMKDAEGRYMMWGPGTMTGVTYSNGYINPTLEHLNDMFNQARTDIEAANAANEKAMFGEEALERQRLQMEKGMFIPPAPQ